MEQIVGLIGRVAVASPTPPAPATRVAGRVDAKRGGGGVGSLSGRRGRLSAAVTLRLQQRHRAPLAHRALYRRDDL